MTQRKHKTTIECMGCGKKFGIIQQSHIDKCDSLQSMGIWSRRKYKERYGTTMSEDAIKVATKNIQARNDSLSIRERSRQGKIGVLAAFKKDPDKYFCHKGGRRGARALWERPGQKKRHADRLVKLNLALLMQQGPNNLEQLFWDLVGQDTIEFASFRFWKTIKTDKGFSHITPDFKVIGADAVIEVYGDYWHAGDDPQTRIDLWKSVGLDCLVIWEHEIHKEPEAIKKIASEYISRNFQECPDPRTSLGCEIV